MNETIRPTLFKTIQTVKKTDVNEIRICENTADPQRTRYTVLVVSDHEVMHKFIEIYDKATYLQDAPNVRMYTDEGKFFIVYPYVSERFLSEFYMGSTMTLRECEEVCTNLIIACMTSNLPWPLLYLMLRQREIHIAKDLSVYISYRYDLTELDPSIDEGDCANECAKILVELLEPKSDRRANSYLLLIKKTDKQSYDRFTELYKDLQIAAEPIRKRGLLLHIKVWFARNRDTIFRVLLWVSILLAIFVLLTFITNLLFGDVPWLRLFTRNFDKIGLESLLQ